MSFLPVPMYKLSAAGNTFVLIDARLNSKWLTVESKIQTSRQKFAQLLCDQTYGVSAHGVLFLEEPLGEEDYKWDFYNSDGSMAEMCGNAARCAARFCFEVLGNDQKARLVFRTGSGLVETVIIDSGIVRVKMPKINMIKLDQEFIVAEKSHKFSLINTGVPHAVMQLSSLGEALSHKDLAKKIRGHKNLGLAGTNVTFYSIEKNGSIQAVTFERGVEDFTPACGTGAVAAAMIYYQTNKHPEVNVVMPGGVLKVLIDEKINESPRLEGDAIFIGEFNYSTEVFHEDV